MEFISIKLKKNFVDYLKILFLTLFSFFICYHYGFNGIVPLDDFVSYNCGYRILSGDIPFKDYYSVFDIEPQYIELSGQESIEELISKTELIDSEKMKKVKIELENQFLHLKK